MCWLFHKWTKWEAYEWRGVIYPSYLSPDREPRPVSELRQRRHCERCGKAQDRLV
jgi:hypothetical protein